MKNFLATITILFGFSASASDCLFGEISDKIRSGSKRLVKLADLELKRGQHFSRHEINLIKKHVNYLAGEDLGLSFNEIRQEYAQGFDDLSMVHLMDASTNRRYTYVWSYPGDNEAGLVLNSKGKVVAEVGDGDIFACKVMK